MARRKIEDTIGGLTALNAHATNPLTNGECDGVLITTAGNLVCRLVDDTADVTLALEKGYFPFRLTHVRATGTTAAGFAAYK